MTTKQQPKVNGYQWDELLSALQKDVRRGNLYEAQHWAVHIESFNPTALWNRLSAIASEDIGLSSPMMPVIIENFRTLYFRDLEKEDPSAYRLHLTRAIAQLCIAKKNRLVDDLLWVVYGEIEHENKRLRIPYYALDHHTVRGRKQNGLKIWEEYGCKLFNEETNIPNPFEERAKEIRRKYKKLTKPIQNPKKQKIVKNKSKSSANLDSFLP